MEYLKELKGEIFKITDKFTKTELQRQLKEATSNEHCHADVSVLNEISYKANNYNDYEVIIGHINKKLNCRREKWRKILKALFLVEHLLKTGPPNFVDSMRSEQYRLKNLSTFSYIDENRADKGETIREKARFILGLLEDSHKLKEERKNYAKWKNRITGVGSGNSSTSGGWDDRYGATSSASYTGYNDYKQSSGKTKKKDESSSSSSSLSSDEEEEKKKKKKKSKKKKEKAKDKEDDDDDDDVKKKENNDEDKKSKKKKKEKEAGGSGININKPGKKDNKTDLIDNNATNTAKSDFDSLFGGTSIPVTNNQQQQTIINNNNNNPFDLFSPSPSTNTTIPSSNNQPHITNDLFSIGNQTPFQIPMSSQSQQQQQQPLNTADDLLKNLANINMGQSSSNYTQSQSQPFNFTQPQQSQQQHQQYNPMGGYNMPQMSNQQFSMPQYQRPQQPSFNFQSQPQPQTQNNNQPQKQAPKQQVIDDNDFTDVIEDDQPQQQKKGGLYDLLDSKLVNLDNLKDTKSSSSTNQPLPSNPNINMNTYNFY